MNEHHRITVAICTYNRVDYLPGLVTALRNQKCDIPFNILFINNNSSDGTVELLDKLSLEPGIPLRTVTETRQGIVYARNRAIQECINDDFMIFMDDDEKPDTNWVMAAYHALNDGSVDCVGGKVDVCFELHPRPQWLGDELLGFLAETDYGDKPFFITDDSTPIWTANIAYNMRVFRNNPDLTFDARYNRIGDGIGGGSDLIMFREFIKRNFIIKYAPNMIIYHHVEQWRLKRNYFFKLHFIAGRKNANHQLPQYKRSILGVPLFLINQAIRQTVKATWLFTIKHPNRIRQGMNASYAFGMIYGSYLASRKSN